MNTRRFDMDLSWMFNLFGWGAGADPSGLTGITDALTDSVNVF